ncbi:rRNA adenine N-6-methyltransferase family protein [Dietzia sp. PP-33]|nr:rRNA adenine N-6-methyltransferase family protein [Dietzia sp. PP-33]
MSCRAFRPEPTVDGAVLVLSRRPCPLLAEQSHSAYRQFVHDVFTGRGRGLASILGTVVHARRRSVRDSSPCAGDGRLGTA